MEKAPRGGGYRLGPAISLLGDGFVSGVDEKIEPVLEELAQRARKRVYFAVLVDGEVTVAQMKATPRSPPVGVAQGFQGAAHALALGKVLLAGEGDEYVECHIEERGLEAFTLRTVVRADLLHAQLNKARMVGLATDFEEFSPNMCCVAAPVMSVGGRVQGAIGLSPRRPDASRRRGVSSSSWCSGRLRRRPCCSGRSVRDAQARGGGGGNLRGRGGEASGPGDRGGCRGRYHAPVRELRALRHVPGGVCGGGPGGHDPGRADGARDACAT